MTKNQIIAQLAERHEVEEMCRNVAHTGIMSADLQDLAQLVYVVLLEYDEGKVLAMWQNGALRFFVARVICNQYRSNGSKFHKEIRAFRTMSTEYSPADYDAAEIAAALG